MSASTDREAENYLIEVHEAFADDERFCRESLSVANEAGVVEPFRWRPAQHKLDQAIKRQQAKGKPVRLVILKTRRSGFSTGVAGKLFKETAFIPGQSTLVVAHEGKAVQESLFPMYDRLQTNYRPFGGIIGMPALVSDRKDGLEWANGSKISIATANNLEGSRSFGYRRVHLSEFAFYRNAKTLMLALMQTVPRDKDTIVIVESTANGVGGEFYELWQQATNPNNQSDWEALFFGCYDDPANWRALDEPAHLFQASLTKEELVLMRQFNLRLEQLNWRRWAIINLCDNSEEGFNQEYPDSPEKAFIVSGRPRFDHRYIADHQAATGSIGELELDERAGQKVLIFHARDKGHLQIFRRPQKNRQYIIGADTALGLDANEGKGSADPDFSVAQIFDRDTGEQVATLRGRITEANFGNYLYRLGAWFNWAFIVPEVQKGYGRSTLDTLIAAGYPLERIYNKRNEAVPTKPRYEDLGWETTVVTRPQLLSALDNALMTGALAIYDSTTLQELRTFVIGADGKAQAQRGCHDDATIALALVVIGIERAPRFKSEQQRNKPQQFQERMRDRILKQRFSNQ